MRIPIWKKWLSFLTEVHIESIESPINDVVHLSLRKGRLMLSTNHAIYSYDDLYTNYQQAIEYWKYDREKKHACLILGYGLGSIPLILEQYCIPLSLIIGIEYDPAVIELASYYSNHRIQSPLELIEADAAMWLPFNESKYDFIAVDVFVDKTTPAFFRSPAFTDAIKKHLKPNAVLMYNFLAQDDEDITLARSYFNSVFIKYFPRGGMMHTHFNLIFVNDTHQFHADAIFLSPEA